MQTVRVVLSRARAAARDHPNCPGLTPDPEDAAPPPRNRWFVDSPLEGNGFEISVPRQIGSGFEASVGLGPIDSRRGGTTRAVVGHGKPIWFADSALEGNGFEPVWGFSCQVVFLVCCRFFVRSGKAVLRSVAAIRFAERAERGQGTEAVAKLGGLPPSGLVFRSALTPEDAER